MNPYTLTRLFWLLLLITAVVLHVLWRRRVEHERRKERQRRERERHKERLERRRYRGEVLLLKRHLRRLQHAFAATPTQKQMQMTNLEGGQHAS